MDGSAEVTEITLGDMTMKVTKTNLRKLVDWSSSRYCSDRKADVVDMMYDILKAGEGRRGWTTGSYSERGHLGGWNWHVNGSTRVVKRQPGFNGEEESVFVFDS